MLKIITLLAVIVAAIAAGAAVWPIVGDAPWEDAVAARPTAEPTVDQTTLIRCQEALAAKREASGRVTAELEERGSRVSNAIDVAEIVINNRERNIGRILTFNERREIFEDLITTLPTPSPVQAERQIAAAERDIARYC